MTNMWKILKEMGILDHLTCFPRNLYAGQKATARTRHGTADSFQIGKGLSGLYIKNLPADAGATGSIPELGRSPWRRE